MIAGRLLEADILYQTGALRTASACLASLARETSRPDARLASLSRLTEIACDLGELADARRHVAEMERVERAATPLTIADRAELNYARARSAVSARDAMLLQRGAREALHFANQSSGSERTWSLAIRINAYLAVDRYHRRDLAGAGVAAQAAIGAMEKTPGALPYIKTHALTTRAVIDLHDPNRSHLALRENVEALTLALLNGMTATARDALFNIVNCWLYCDDSVHSSREAHVAQESLQEILMDPRSIGDPLLAATSLSTCGRYDEAIELIDGSDVRSADEGTGWVPIFFEPVTATRRARILFKAGRYAEAERAAAHALDVWDRSGLGGGGTALRVRAEALEALGEVAPATEAIENAIAALQLLSPVHHMVGAYQCGFRLTKKPTYRNAAGDLIAGLNKGAVSPQGMQLTPREREIALLVTEGKTNKDIGTRLGISRRTVDNHVASVFNRLSIRARWQLTTDLIDRF